ncbi:MAG: preprotein translocase subunit SecE [Propionibacteriaceae bacterium]|nr:preprotein translocase subunit SecE [Propionibacteriaceae bacterium]
MAEDLNGITPEADDALADAAEQAAEEAITDPDELAADPAVSEAEAIAAQVAGARPVRKSASETKKGAPTPSRRTATATEEVQRTGPVQFVKESIEELKRVNWPTLSQWQQYFWVVLIFVGFVIAYVSLLDLGIGVGLLAIFG